MNTQLPDAIRVDALAAFVQRRIRVVQPSPASDADWPDQAVDACAPEGAYPAGLDGAQAPLPARLGV